MIAPIVLAASATVTTGAVDANRTYVIDELDDEGFGATKRETVLELLPRPLPAALTGREILEFSRRVKNLALFDLVEVDVVDRVLHIRVRRKTTISPIIDFSSGKTLRDSKGTLGAIEHDIDGRATRLGGRASYSERGLNFVVWLAEHPYSPTRWMNEYEVYYAGSGFRFAPPSEGGAETKWHRNRLGGEIEWLSPFVYGSRFRYELQLNAYRESYSFASDGVALRPGVYVGTTSELIWDAYTWNDLTPSGFRAVLELRPGVFLGAGETLGQPRHELRAKTLFGAKLGTHTALVGFAMFAGVNQGNPNHSVLLGSQQGVRGLADSLYRNDLHAFTNLELRHAFSLGKRWYLQGVLFTDAARFRPMDARGDGTAWQNAWSTGAGIRILPTALVDTLLRFDVSRLHAPEGAWFYQIGINQYI